MGLLLLIPGLILQLNNTTWFSGEDSVGRVLVIVGAVILAIQLLIMVAAGLYAKREFNRF